MIKLKLFIIFINIYNIYSFVIIPNNFNNHKIKPIQNNFYKPQNKYTLLNQNNKNINTPITIKNNKLYIYGINPTSQIWAIILVYFVQGIIGLSNLAVTFYYKDTLHLSPSELSFISSLTVIPWLIKPFYGYISDTFPLFGYKRKIYLILSGIISSLGWFGMSQLVLQLQDINSKWIAILLLNMTSLGMAFSDVLVDALVVSLSQNENISGSLQSICWSSASIGGIISSYASGSLLEKLGKSEIFALTACFPLITALVGIFINEKKIDNNNNNNKKIIKQLILLKKALSNKSILLPIIFLVLWQATPSSGSSFFYFETNELNFKPEFFGKLSLISSLSSLCGIYIYNKYLKEIPLRDMFKKISIIGLLLGLTPIVLITHTNRILGLPDELFAIGDDVILSIVGQIAFMPVLVLATEICPSGIEASLYATIMSINNLSGTISSLLGSYATKLAGITETNFDNLVNLIIITNIIGLLPMFFLNLLPENIKKKK